MATSLAMLLAALVLWPAAVCVYRLYLHPLSHVPGPRLAAVTSVWYARQVAKSRFRFSLDLHEKYGPVVRVRPNEVMCNSREAFRAIYDSKASIQKGEWYSALAPPTFDWLFRRKPPARFTINGEMDIERYRSYRRAIGGTYSAATVRKYSARIDEVLKRLVSKLRTHEGETLDLVHWIHLAMAECVTAVVLDWSPGFMEKETDHEWLKGSTQNWLQFSVFGHLPAVSLLIQKVPGLKGIAMACMGITSDRYKYAGHMKTPFPGLIAQRVADFTSSSTERGKEHHEDMLEDLLQISETKTHWKPAYAGGMANVTFNAGHETTTSSAVSTISLICQNPSIKRRVIEEARGGINNEEYIYIQACIKEAIRLVPVVTMSLPRKIPAGQSLSLNGYVLPAGTNVGANPISLHNNPDIFGADAGEFRPERWLGDSDKVKVLEKTSLAWGGGAHTCPGRNMAELILCKIIPILFREFEIEVDAPEMESMQSFNYLGFLSGTRVRFWGRSGKRG